MRYRVAGVIVVISLIIPAAAVGQGFNMPKNWMPIGGAVGIGSRGVFGGAEVSLVHIGDAFGSGGYFDIIRNSEGTRISFGPEVLLPIKVFPGNGGMLGFDGGYVLWHNSAQNGDGFTVRMFVAHMVTPFVRYSRIGGESLIDWGFLVKIPIPLR